MAENVIENLWKQFDNFKPGKIISGRIVELKESHVVLDIGYKTEGCVSKAEFKDFEALEPGQEVKVMLEDVDTNDSGFIPLSKEKADLVLNWDRVESACRNGTRLKGKILVSVKGGFRVDIGIPAFLPASQADLKPITDSKNLINHVFEFKVIKLDRMKNNIVVSRRDILEEEKKVRKRAALEKFQVGQNLQGTVRNITDYGVFVDLGEITGLVHINDLSWSRINHPSQVVAVGDNVEVKVLKISDEKGEVSLGIKQLGLNPWDKIEERYPVGSRIQGKVVNLTDYGAFIKLEDGVEGLLHISEVSWTAKVKSPSDVLTMGDNVEAQIIALEPDKQKISFSMKALEPNPWEGMPEKYPVGTVIKGKVYSLTTYGAFIEIEKGIEGLLHVKDLAWEKVKHPSDILKKGEKIEVVVLNLDPEKRRISLGRKQLLPPPEKSEAKGEKEDEEKPGKNSEKKGSVKDKMIKNDR